MPPGDEGELAQRRIVAQREQVRVRPLDRVDQVDARGGEVLDLEPLAGDERRDRLLLGRVAHADEIGKALLKLRDSRPLS